VQLGGAQAPPRANEIQTVNVSTAACDTAGDTYSLAFTGVSTGPLTCNTVTGSSIEAALEGVSSIGAGNVAVFGLAQAPGAAMAYTFSVMFTGDLGATDVPLLTAAVGRDTAGDGAVPIVVESVAGGGDFPPGGLQGAPPAPGGIGLMVANRQMAAAQIRSEFASSGCAAAVLAVIQGGQWRVHITGAPDPVNAGFPAALQTGTPFFVRCAPDGTAGAAAPMVALERVVAAIQARDQIRLRALVADGEPTREQAREQEIVRLAACLPQGATVGLEQRSVVVDGNEATATVRLRFALGETGVGVEQTWRLRFTDEQQWQLVDVPSCALDGGLGSGAGTLNTVISQYVEAIRDRDRDRLRDHTGDGTPDRVQDRDRDLDQLASCTPVGAGLQWLSSEIDASGTQATANVRLRLEGDGVGSVIQQTWRLQRTTQNQWQLVDPPACPFA
jgi:hypothetical protein